MKSVWNTNFFTRLAIAKIHFVLQFNYTGDTPYGVWFNLNNFLTHWKRPIFKIPFSRNSKISVWNPYEILTFPTRQAIPKNPFVLHFKQKILHTVFRSIWATFWPNEKDLFLKFPFQKIQKVPYEILTFFPRQTTAKTFFVQHSTYTGNTPYRVWFGLVNSLTR